MRRRWICPRWIGARIVVLLVGCASFHPSSVTGDLPNFSPVNEGLYRGGQPSDQGFHLLADRGVKTVVSLRHHDEGEIREKKVVESLGLRWINIPVRSWERPTDDQIRQFLSVALDPAHQPVFVHCYEGKNRAGMMVAIYRIVHDGWPPPQALEEADHFGMNPLHVPAHRLILKEGTRFKAIRLDAH